MSNIPTPPIPPPRAANVVPVPEEPTLASRVMSGAAAVVAPVSAAAGAAAHAVAEQSHRSLEKVEQTVAVTETAPSSIRMAAAKSAIEHHGEALRHQSLKVEDTEASGLPAAKDRVATAASYASASVSSAASAVPSQVSNAASKVSSSLSWGAHGIAEQSHKSVEAAEQAVCVSEHVPSQVRFAAAQSALEHHNKAKEHAVAKDESYEGSGLSTVGTAIKNAYDKVAAGAVSAYNSMVGTTAETKENADAAAAAAASRQSA